MGKVVKYDFRKETRHKEYNEIQDRVIERMIAQLEDPNYYLDLKVQEQVKRDNLRALQLEEEAKQWNDNLGDF